MADAPNTVATLNGLFKKIYAPSIVNLIPDFAILQKRVPFSKGERLGDYFNQPVSLAHEAGFSYLGEAGAVATLSDAVAGVMKEAQIRGSESLCFYSTNGKIEIVSHPLVKDGDAFLLPLDSIQRIGSSDVTYGVPGMDEQFFTLVANKNAVEIQCTTDQAIFLDHPAWGVYLSGITYS